MCGLGAEEVVWLLIVTIGGILVEPDSIGGYSPASLVSISTMSNYSVEASWDAINCARPAVTYDTKSNPCM